MADANQRARAMFRRRRGAPRDAASTPVAGPRPANDERPRTDVAEAVPYGMRLAAAWSWRLLLVGGVIAVVVFLIIQLRLIVIPLLVAVLVAALLVPFSQLLQRRLRFPKWVAVTVSMLSALAVVGGLLTLGITQIVRGSDELAAQTLVAWDDFRAWLLEGPFHITEQQLNDFVAQVLDAAQDDSGVLLSGALSVGSTLAGSRPATSKIACAKPCHEVRPALVPW